MIWVAALRDGEFRERGAFVNASLW